MAKAKKPILNLALVSHAFAELVPGGLTEDEHAALVEDVRENGVRCPIALYQGKILDGRARYRAAKDAGVDCPAEELQGFTDEDARHYVYSTNLHRRTLAPMQKALAIAELYKRAITLDGPKPSQDKLAHRYGTSKQTLNLCIRALDSKNQMLLTRMRRGEVTRVELEEEFYDHKPDATGTDMLEGSAPPSVGTVVQFPQGGKAGAAAVVGTRPEHPERKTKETSASVVAQHFKALSEEDRCAFVGLAWPWLELAVEAHKVTLGAMRKASSRSSPRRRQRVA
jgi:hypothetical protein